MHSQWGMRHLRATVALSLFLSANAASASPSPWKLENPLAEPGVVLREAPSRVRASLSVHASVRTVQLASPAIAASSAELAASAPPRFARDGLMREAWRLDLEGPLRRPSTAGNVIFVFFDLDNRTRSPITATSAYIR